MLHSSDLFEFGSDANTTDVRCKVAYKVSMTPLQSNITYNFLELSSQRQNEIILLLPQHPLWRFRHQHGRQDWRVSEREVSVGNILNIQTVIKKAF